MRVRARPRRVFRFRMRCRLQRIRAGWAWEIASSCFTSRWVNRAVCLCSGIRRQIGSEAVAWPSSAAREVGVRHGVRRSTCVGTAFAILLAAATASLAAQTGTIRGRVVRADWPVGLADARLELRPCGATTRTDARGFFVFRGIPTGQVEVDVRRVGFGPTVVVIQVDSLAVTQVDIALEPVPTLLNPIVTSATRDARSLSEVAAAVSVADTSV